MASRYLVLARTPPQRADGADHSARPLPRLLSHVTAMVAASRAACPVMGAVVAAATPTGCQIASGVRVVSQVLRCRRRGQIAAASPPDGHPICMRDVAVPRILQPAARATLGSRVVLTGAAGGAEAGQTGGRAGPAGGEWQ